MSQQTIDNQKNRFTPHGADLFGEPAEKKHTSKLGDEFLIPPFSVLSAREGWWQERKRAWLDMGIQSELGRGEQLIENGGGMGSKDRYDKRGGVMAFNGGMVQNSMANRYGKPKAQT